jgi:thioredoxin-like negative regulator of GroEL
MTIDYKKKYLKYKNKYLDAKKQKNHNKMSGGQLKIQDELNEIMGDMKINNKQFESFVKQNKENILVIIYAHWCGHCVNMIKEIGNELKLDSNSIRIKYLDGTKLTNELKKNLEVRGFPTIIKIKDSIDINNLNKIEYEGPRMVKDIIDFLNK